MCQVVIFAVHTCCYSDGCICNR